MATPNWKLLTAFEAAARHRSFTRAAQELNVQQPAISRRVAALETELGVSLLKRTRPNVSLTREGEVLFRAVAGSILQVSSAAEQICCPPDKDVVTVNTTIGFASCYLMKRLPAFRTAHPEISVELISRDQNNAYGPDADIIIAFDHPDRLPGVRHRLIFQETMIAVAHPKVANTIPDTPAALAQSPLLHLTMGNHTDDWNTFFAGTGLKPPPPVSERKFTSFMVYLQAALNGDGVILGWQTLLQDHFDHGQLATVTTRRLSTKRGYFVCLTERAQSNAAALKIMDWLADATP
ncbi:LysR substrate-binding domain-containing protein [Ruegeria sp. ANG10]|uniref:LysR substrate-binding domain-containing protein n=1 Tax=Ruegeria sp. ANG10 TaxID=3042467 RepID=UPI003457188A